jgi:hypothetical protein
MRARIRFRDLDVESILIAGKEKKLIFTPSGHQCICFGYEPRGHMVRSWTCIDY